MFALRRLAILAGTAVTMVVAAACSRSTASSQPVIRIVEDARNAAASYVEVTGVDADTLAAAREFVPASDSWPRLLGVHVIGDDGVVSPTAMAGRYAVAGDVLRFTPLFPFDPGRQYEVRFARAGQPAGEPSAVLRKVVARPAAPTLPTTVAGVYPSADEVPSNQLRMYIHFSAPMGRRGGLEHVRLIDERGQTVIDPFLPLDAELWNLDRTRYTLFFDPGRQKRGILPNRELGRSLVEGKRYTLVIDREWRDGHGQPLAQSFTRTFRVGPPHEGGLDCAAWRVTPPSQGTRDPLSVQFPEPLDHGLLLHAIGVRRDGRPVNGEVRVDAHETRWTLTPSEAWRPGRYELVALSILEDLAGNRIGRAFEVDTLARAVPESDPAETAIPFVVR
jgi:hypothetical protein